MKQTLNILLLIVLFLAFSCKEHVYTVEEMFDAANHGDIETLQLCLAQGLDVNSKEESGWSLLDESVSWNESSDTTKFLLENGANPQNIKTRENPSFNGLLKRYTYQTLNSSTYKPEITKLLLENGADPNMFGISEVSPLMDYIDNLYKFKR